MTSALAERLVDDGLEAIADTGVHYRSMTGVVVPYDVAADVGFFTESFARGSFTRSLANKSAVPLLLFHDNRSFPVGVSELWSDDAIGLIGTFTLNLSVEAQRAGAAAERGELTGLSVGFQPVKSEWQYAHDWNPDEGRVDHVTRTRARLLEVSMTPTPAYADAQVLTVSADVLDRDSVSMYREAARIGRQAETMPVDPTVDATTGADVVAGLQAQIDALAWRVAVLEGTADGNATPYDPALAPTPALAVTP